jgi:hypothetical protein
MTSKSAGIVHCLSQMLDRRTFLGHAGIAAGALIVSGVMPLSSDHASQSGRSTAAAAPGLPSAAVDSSELWHVDDMWGHWPRYAHPIPHARAQADMACWEKAALIDQMWVS